MVSKSDSHGLCGFGESSAEIAIYIANRPTFDDYPLMTDFRPLAPMELDYIVANTSNHWRKLFNVFAKFIFEFKGSENAVSSWQEYRDYRLLQRDCSEALIFSPPQMHRQISMPKAPIQIIAGKTYASSLALPIPLYWEDSYFAINREFRVIVCPYLDYRQLSNTRISRLVAYCQTLQQC